MSSPIFQKKLLPGVIALALAGAPFQHLLAADEAAAPTDQDAEILEVRGIRDSLRANLGKKRDADDVREVVTAEDIGKFPDKNVAESLQRITGVSIQRTFGEGERVSIRGTAPNLNRTLLNGHSVATADWFILDQLNATRSFNYLMLPSEIVGQLDVIKSPQADVEEGSIGGVVNVSTRKPLQMKEPLTLAGTVQMIRNDKSGETDPLLSGLISWKNESSDFGVLLSIQKSEHNIRRDGIEVLGYSDRAIADQGGATYAIPDLMGAAYFTQQRDRQSTNLSVQWLPTNDLDITFNAMQAEMDADNVNHNMLAWFSNMLGAGEQPYDTVVDGNGTVVAGRFDESATGWGAVYDTFVREAFTETNAYDLDLKYSVGDWTITGKLGTTDAEGGTDRQLIWETIARTGFTWDLRGSVPRFAFTDIDPTDPNALDTNGWNGERDVGNEDSEDFAYIDAEWLLDGDFFTAIKFGLKSTDHERKVWFNGLVGHDLYGPTSCGGQPCGVAPVAGGLLPSDFMSGHGGIINYRLVDPDQLYAIYNAIPTQGRCTPSGQTYPPSCWSPVASSSYSITEEALGGYLMARFAGDGFRGNVGVRVVETDVSADGFRTGLAADFPGASWSLFDGYYAPYTQRSDYRDVLPSLNIAFDIAEDWILRVGAAEVMARPDYGRMSPVVSLNSTSFTGSGGSPDLDPYRARQLDLSAEWYISDDSALSIAYFHKDIESYIINRTRDEAHPTDFTDSPVPPGDNCTLIENDLYSCVYRIDRPENGDGGTNKGVEVAYQQVFGNGFGFSGNYTYSDAETDDGDEIPGNSEHTYNLSAFFENELLSARVSYNYRDEFFVDIQNSRQQWSSETKWLDASLSVNVMEHVQLVVEGSNLTEEELVYYYDGIEDRPNAVYQTGAVYYAGVRLRF